MCVGGIVEDLERCQGREKEEKKLRKNSIHAGGNREGKPLLGGYSGILNDLGKKSAGILDLD